MSSAPPAVSILTRVGATFADDAFMAFSVACVNVDCGNAGPLIAVTYPKHDPTILLRKSIAWVR